MIEQVGWYNPGRHLTTDLNYKGIHPDNYKRYWVPVYAVACDLCKKHPCTCPKRK